MTVDYIEPPRGRHISDADSVYCTSDVHLGNTRWTNDLHKQTAMPNYKAFVSFLDEIADVVKAAFKPGVQNFNVLDLVLHGDIFDYWKAIPDPLPGEETLHLHTDADYIERFREILAYNSEVLVSLCRILRPPPGPGQEGEVGAQLYILPGNHDALPRQPNGALSTLIASHLKPMLLDAMAAAAVGVNLIPAGAAAGYSAKLAPQIHWEIDKEVYDNTKLLLHVQHGHRWDNANLPRHENTLDMLAEGQILVESFINGLHDINLSTYQPAWEHVRTLLSRKPAPDNINLAAVGRNIDNFDSDLDAADYLTAVVSAHGGEADALLRNTTSSTFWQMDWKALSALSGLPVISSIGELCKRAFDALRRRAFGPALVAEARKLLAGSYAHIWPTVPKVVVFGHTHIFDVDPAKNPNPGKPQYVNSGTWVDVLKYDSSKPDKPSKLPYECPVHCRLVAMPGPHTEVQIREKGVWLIQARIPLP